MATKTAKSKAAEQFIRQACARNTSAELHYERPDGRFSTCRTRLLQVSSAGQIIVETPRYGPDIPRIPLRQGISVYLLLGGTRYQFESSIQEGAVTVQLNQHVRVRAVALTMPSRIYNTQRRVHYRVSMAAGDPITVWIVPCHPKIADACELDIIAVEGRLVNLSAGGAAILVDACFSRMFAANKCFYASFCLPGEDVGFDLLCTVRHLRPIASRESLRIGMAFLPYGDTDFKGEQRRIVQFLAVHERRLLKRRK